MAQLKRFWFVIPGHLGIGVTAFSRAEADRLAADAAERLGWPCPSGLVIEDVDVRELDQGHVVPNMGPAAVRGVWYPRLHS